jgi:hypothetical protein
MADRFDLTENDGSRENAGYDGIPSDYQIPSCTIEDVDFAVFSVFDEDIKFFVGDEQNGYKKAPVIFASGEKWVLLKRGRALRDKTGTLILPLITITRNGLNQSDNNQRGINPYVGNMTFRRRLSEKDFEYQNAINKLNIQNQDNVATNDSSKQFSTRNQIGELQNQTDFNSPTLKLHRKNNIHEVITVPTPQFFIATYEITFWTQYTQHMNQLIEKMIASQLPFGNTIKVETKKGYWFVGTIDGATFNIETNFSDMSSEERYMKTTFTFNVPAYLFLPDVPGGMVGVRSQIFAPVVNFDASDSVITYEENLIQEQDPTLDEHKNKTSYSSQTFDGRNPLNTQTSTTQIMRIKNLVAKRKTINRDETRIVDDKTGKLINIE